MIITAPLSLKHTIWERAKEICKIQSELTSKTEIFDRLVDLFICACTVGIQKGERIENDTKEEIHSISHKVINDPNNTNLVEIFDFLTKIVILTCDEPELNSLNDKEKQKLAFDGFNDLEENEVENGLFNLNKSKLQIFNILCTYANYGLTKILENSTNHTLELLDNIYSSMYDLSKENDELPDLEEFGICNF